MVGSQKSRVLVPARMTVTHGRMLPPILRASGTKLEREGLPHSHRKVRSMSWSEYLCLLQDSLKQVQKRRFFLGP